MNPMQLLDVAVRQAQALSEAERESWNGWKNTNALVPDFLISTYRLRSLIPARVASLRFPL